MPINPAGTTNQEGDSDVEGRAHEEGDEQDRVLDLR